MSDFLPLQFEKTYVIKKSFGGEVRYLISFWSMQTGKSPQRHAIWTTDKTMATKLPYAYLMSEVRMHGRNTWVEEYIE